MNYQTANRSLYPGRSSEKQYYLREYIEFADIRRQEKITKSAIALLGYCCDEGVRRNQGRVGAKKGPNAIRAQLGKLSNHFDQPIIDFGNISCDDTNLEATQEILAKQVQLLISNQQKPILLGGGHDIALGHFKGLANALTNKTIGIINFDPHLDLRTPNPQGNSGTPFYQVAKLIGKNHFYYLPIGIREESNHHGLLQTAKTLGVEPILLEECTNWPPRMDKKLLEFIQRVDCIYITIDLDSFSSSYAPGVSAPHPMGLDPQFVFHCLELIFKSKKVISVDLAEMNPTYDQDQATAKLAASIIYKIIRLW